jgi:3-oxoacyl-[acyl-carrier-protein] synthase II
VLFPPTDSRSAGSIESRRVVVTGCGLATALGNTWEANALGFREGRSAFRGVRRFPVDRQRVKIAGEVDLPEEFPFPGVSERDLHRTDHGAKMLLWAGEQCMAQAGWSKGSEAPLVFGTTSGGMLLGQDYYRNAIAPTSSRRMQSERSVYYQAQRQVTLLKQAHGLIGSALVIANACASGANAIGLAWQLVRFGQAERALCGGYDALCELVFAGFDSLQALSPTVCRPFDEHRDGLALGEGAAVFAIETLAGAKARGARILGEICGYAAGTDCHHLTQPHPCGLAAVDTMTRACAVAGLSPGEIQYVNAHGTGTPMNDASETEAINCWAGNTVGDLRVSSTKASVGHLLGAAGAVEVAVCLMALQGQWLPPTRTCRKPDPACRFGLITEPQAASLNHVITNSFGFGGANASLVLGGAG